jgi:hypothetical protein
MIPSIVGWALVSPLKAKRRTITEIINPEVELEQTRTKG